MIRLESVEKKRSLREASCELQLANKRLDGSAQRFAQLWQSLFGRGVNLASQTRPQEIVLVIEEDNVFCQFRISSAAPGSFSLQIPVFWSFSAFAGQLADLVYEAEDPKSPKPLNAKGLAPLNQLDALLFKQSQRMGFTALMIGFGVFPSFVNSHSTLGGTSA